MFFLAHNSRESGRLKGPGNDDGRDIRFLKHGDRHLEPFFGKALKIADLRGPEYLHPA